MMEDHKIEQWTRGDYNYESDIKMTSSGPDIRLTELEQQLEVAETRCGSLKSQLDYMKMLYQGVQPCSAEELIETVEERPQSQTKNVVESSPREALNENEKILEDKENYEENNTTATVEDVKYYQFLKEIRKMQEITSELDSDLKKTSPRQSSRSPNITPRLTERRYPALEEEHEDISAEFRYTKQIRKAHIVVGSAGEIAPEPLSILKSATGSVTSIEIPEILQACKEHDTDDPTTPKQPTDYTARLQNHLTTARNLTSRFIAEDHSECWENRHVNKKEDTKKQELVLKLSESMDSAPITVKRKRIAKVDKKQRTGSCVGSVVKKTLNSKYDDTLSVTSNNKSKRKKVKLRGATSRHTVTTKEANLTERRETKKRKQKGYSSATHMPHRFQAPTQHVPRTRAEVVEIYHNNAVEGGSGSISISSSKHSKHEAAEKPRNNNLPKKDGSVQMCSAVTYQQQQQLTHRQQSRVPDRKDLQDETDTRATFDQNSNEGYQKYDCVKSPKSQNCGIRDSNGEEAQCCSAPHPSRYYDPTITRNYELPTVASKLKKVNRSYFNRFNFRNIPFVVSTSVTPSHNLGLNIQQVLSIMKTRQPMATGMTPLLIRKMSKGIKPASMLLDRIHESSCTQKSPNNATSGRQNNFISSERPKTTTECCSPAVDGTVKSKYTGCLTAQMGRLQFIPSTQINSDEKTSLNHLLDEVKGGPEEGNWVQEQESGCVCCPKKSKSYNKMLKQYTSRKSITGNPALTASALLRERQEEINIGDNEYNQTESVSDNAKGIREVLMNLHDQFEELNIAYEKLQERATKSNDKSITKQLTALEKELNDKEAEINAVVGLYKEVLQLKQQVNSSHGKNSFVCITTSGNQSSPVMVPRSGYMRAQSMANPMQIFGKSILSNAHEPATATRLTGLLREIQSFQKQLLSL